MIDELNLESDTSDICRKRGEPKKMDLNAERGKVDFAYGPDINYPTKLVP